MRDKCCCERSISTHFGEPTKALLSILRIDGLFGETRPDQFRMFSRQTRSSFFQRESTSRIERVACLKSRSIEALLEKMQPFVDLLIVIESTVGVILFRCQTRFGFFTDDETASVENTDGVKEEIAHPLCAVWHWPCIGTDSRSRRESLRTSSPEYRSRQCDSADPEHVGYLREHALKDTAWCEQVVLSFPHRALTS